MNHYLGQSESCLCRCRLIVEAESIEQAKDIMVKFLLWKNYPQLIDELVVIEWDVRRGVIWAEFI